jgi:hypothetical protein
VPQIGEGDGRHQRVAMQTRPGAPCEVAQAEFLLELLVGLFTHPACRDGSSQSAQRRARRQVAEVEFTLAVRAPFANQPRRLPADANCYKGQAATYPNLPAANRAASVPLVPCRQMTRRYVKTALTVRASPSGTRRRLRPPGAISARPCRRLLTEGNAHSPALLASTKPVAKGRTGAIPASVGTMPNRTPAARN